jgi:DNA-binding transcriptional ArsR family regulator
VSLDEGAQTESQPDQAGSAALRTISDARTLRALAHPVRIALLEALHLGGAMTATEVGERIGESPTTCSFHLRQLAKYGLVEEAGGGKGRARPWRLTMIGFTVSADDSESELAGRALVRLVRARQLDRYQTWLETSASYPRRWREAAFDGEYIPYQTIDEMEQLTEELAGQLWPLYQERMADPSKRPPGSVPVELLLMSFPLERSGAGAGESGD